MLRYRYDFNLTDLLTVAHPLETVHQSLAVLAFLIFIYVTLIHLIKRAGPVNVIVVRAQHVYNDTILIRIESMHVATYRSLIEYLSFVQNNLRSYKRVKCH